MPGEARKGLARLLKEWARVIGVLLTVAALGFGAGMTVQALRRDREFDELVAEKMRLEDAISGCERSKTTTCECTTACNILRLPEIGGDPRFARELQDGMISDFGTDNGINEMGVEFRVFDDSEFNGKSTVKYSTNDGVLSLAVRFGEGNFQSHYVGIDTYFSPDPRRYMDLGRYTGVEMRARLSGSLTGPDGNIHCYFQLGDHRSTTNAFPEAEFLIDADNEWHRIRRDFVQFRPPAWAKGESSPLDVARVFKFALLLRGASFEGVLAIDYVKFY